MAEKYTDTICPHCEAKGGTLASLCPNPACKNSGYHFIPAINFRKNEGHKGYKEAPVDPLIGRLIDKYLLVEKLAEGGMGAVYMAIQLPLKRKVAIKMLVGVELKPQDRKRFEREATSISLLYHPNIVSLFEYGFCPDTGAPFMVLEYVQGKSLAELIGEKKRKNEPWQEDVVLNISSQILNGLEVAHKKGLVHRDIKPQNIMLTNIEGNPYFVKILDFGLARAIVEIPGIEVITSQGELWGTPEYMAPEQLIDSGTIDHRCDLYAVSVILLEMFTGEAVFRRKSLNEIFALKLDERFDPLSCISEGILSKSMIKFFEKGLQRNPEKRFYNAVEMKNALISALKGNIEEIEVENSKEASISKGYSENQNAKLQEEKGSDSDSKTEITCRASKNRFFSFINYVSRLISSDKSKNKTKKTIKGK